MTYSILKIKGPDAAAFLHRQSSNDIDQLKEGEGNYVSFLNPQGKIRNLVYLIKSADGFDLVVDSKKLDHLEEDLKKYAIVEELEFEKPSVEVPSDIELEEFTESDNLIKLNLIPKYVSFSKGCFPGQEVLAKFKNVGEKKRKERANKYLDEALEVFNSAPNEGKEAEEANDKAIELLKKAIKDDPQCEDAYESLGVIMGRQNRNNERA